MRRPPWTTVTIVFAVVLLGIATAPTFFNLQFRFGYELSEEMLPVMIFNSVLSTLSGPCALVGIGTLAALLAARLVLPRPAAPIEPERAADDLEYLLERDPS
jgi:p-aminobenzoyl-glutamate transporter AbgT